MRAFVLAQKANDKVLETTKKERQAASLARGNARLQIRMLKSERKMYLEKAEEMMKKGNDLAYKIEEQAKIEEAHNKIVIEKTKDLEIFQNCKKAVEEYLK